MPIQTKTSRNIAFLLLPILAIIIITTTQFAIQPSSKPVPNPSELRIMTYNIRHAEGLDGKVRPESILRELESSRFDIISLQEVDRYKWRSGFQDQARYFARALGMHYAYAPAIRSGFSQYGIALLSRYPLDSPQQVVLNGGREPRVVLMAELRLGGRKFTVATTHLGVTSAEREKQLPQLLAALKPIRTPLILMGDFNSPALALVQHVHQLGLTEMPLPIPTPTVIKGGTIDHIFISSGLASKLQVSVISSRASDHLPVVGALALK